MKRFDNRQVAIINGSKKLQYLFGCHDPVMECWIPPAEAVPAEAVDPKAVDPPLLGAWSLQLPVDDQASTVSSSIVGFMPDSRRWYLAGCHPYSAPLQKADNQQAQSASLSQAVCSLGSDSLEFELSSAASEFSSFNTTIGLRQHLSIPQHSLCLQLRPLSVGLVSAQCLAVEPMVVGGCIAFNTLWLHVVY